jgi:hypothetical protein
MDRILTRLKGVKMEDIKSVLKADAADHAEQGLVLRHIWRNADDPDEIVFIFTAADPDRARTFIGTAHEQVQSKPQCKPAADAILERRISCSSSSFRLCA